MLLPCSQNGLFLSHPNRQGGESLLCRSQNRMKTRPIRRRSLPDTRRLRWRFSFYAWFLISVSAGQRGLLPRQPKVT